MTSAWFRATGILLRTKEALELEWPQRTALYTTDLSLCSPGKESSPGMFSPTGGLFGGSDPRSVNMSYQPEPGG